MALDSTALPPDAEAPSADTPDAPAENTAGNTPAPPQPVDWEARYKAAQAELTRVAQARARERTAAIPDPEDDEEEPDEAPAPRQSGRQSRALQEALQRNEILERQVAESVHGPEIVSAYDEWVDVWNGTETESDRVTALLAFADRLRGNPPAAAPALAGTSSREQAVQPRVDLNRSDAAPDVDLDIEKFEGRDDDGKGWFRAQLEKITG